MRGFPEFLRHPCLPRALERLGGAHEPLDPLAAPPRVLGTKSIAVHHAPKPIDGAPEGLARRIEPPAGNRLLRLAERALEIFRGRHIPGFAGRPLADLAREDRVQLLGLEPQLPRLLGPSLALGEERLLPELRDAVDHLLQGAALARFRLALRLLGPSLGAHCLELLRGALDGRPELLRAALCLGSRLVIVGVLNRLLRLDELVLELADAPFERGSLLLARERSRQEQHQSRHDQPHVGTSS